MKFEVFIVSPRISTILVCPCCLGPVEDQDKVTGTTQYGNLRTSYSFNFGICRECKKHRTDLWVKRLVFVVAVIVLSAVMANIIGRYYLADFNQANLITAGSVLFNGFVLSKIIRLRRLSANHTTRGRAVEMVGSSIFRFSNQQYALRFAEANQSHVSEVKRGKSCLGMSILCGNALLWIIPLVFLCTFLATPQREFFRSYVEPEEVVALEETVADSINWEGLDPSLGEEGVAPIPPEVVEEVYSPPPVNTPKNGVFKVYTRKERVAPLKFFSTTGTEYFIKLVDYGTESDVMTIYVRSNSTVEIDVPLGSYRVKYACGEQWYGEKYLFGNDTSYFVADEVFRFSYSGNYVSGYTVTLYSVPGGNLETSQIDEDEF